MKCVLRSFVPIINYKCLIATALAAISGEVYFHYILIAKFPDMPVGVAIVFPVVFSCAAYSNKMVITFDNMKIIQSHGAPPVTLRAYSKVFIYIFPIIYRPFASTFRDFSHSLEYDFV